MTKHPKKCDSKCKCTKCGGGKKHHSGKKRKLSPALKAFNAAKKKAIASNSSSFTYNGKTYKKTGKSIGTNPIFKRA